MKKILILVLSIGLLGCGSTAVLDTEYLQLEYPKNWSVDTENKLSLQPGFENILATYIFDTGEELKSQLIINIEPIEPGSTLETYRKLTKEIILENFPEVEFSGETQTSIGGAETITLSHANNGRNWMQSWTLHNEKIYTMTASIPTETSNAPKEKINQVLQTVTLKDH